MIVYDCYEYHFVIGIENFGTYGFGPLSVAKALNSIKYEYCYSKVYVVIFAGGKFCDCVI